MYLRIRKELNNKLKGMKTKFPLIDTKELEKDNFILKFKHIKEPINFKLVKEHFTDDGDSLMYVVFLEDIDYLLLEEIEYHYEITKEIIDNILFEFNMNIKYIQRQIKMFREHFIYNLTYMGFKSSKVKDEEGHDIIYNKVIIYDELQNQILSEIDLLKKEIKLIEDKAFLDVHIKMIYDLIDVLYGYYCKEYPEYY